MKYDLAIIHIDRLLPFSANPNRGLRGEDMEHSPEIEDGAIAIKDGTICFVGTTGDFRKMADVSEGITINAKGRSVIPGFIDAHTHLPFYGWRQAEVARGRGKSYGKVIHEGGGIKASVKEMEAATDDEVLRFVTGLMDHMHAWGTTTLEAKSGYSLTVAGELRELHLIQELIKTSPMTIVPTCLAAHDVPVGYTGDEWIEEIIHHMLPHVAEHNLARTVDIYIEPFAFEVPHARRLAEATLALGLIPRAHTDQVNNIGGCREAVRLGFSSVDHLN